MNSSAQSQILAMTTLGIQPLTVAESSMIAGGDNTATVSVGSPARLTLSGGSSSSGVNWYSAFFAVCDNA